MKTVTIVLKEGVSLCIDLIEYAPFDIYSITITCDVNNPDTHRVLTIEHDLRSKPKMDLRSCKI